MSWKGIGWCRSWVDPGEDRSWLGLRTYGRWLHPARRKGGDVMADVVAGTPVRHAGHHRQERRLDLGFSSADKTRALSRGSR